MDHNVGFLLRISVFLVLVGFGSSAAFLDDSVILAHGSVGRSLLQESQSCPIDFESLNYTIITNQCKGPEYSANVCCSAFVQFACPYAAELNDLSNDCASSMFSYINIYGKYPPGLFSSECKEGKQGLACPANTPSASPDGSGAARPTERSRLHYVTIPFTFILILKIII